VVVTVETLVCRVPVAGVNRPTHVSTFVEWAIVRLLPAVLDLLTTCLLRVGSVEDGTMHVMQSRAPVGKPYIRHVVIVPSVVIGRLCTRLPELRRG